MNILFRLFVFMGSLVVVALFAALIAPYFINWDEFTDEFEREATRVVGQPVKVGGDTQVRLLPLPSLRFNELEVGKNDDGSPLMTVERFSLQAELFPFLTGEVRIVDMDMQKPEIKLQVDERGRIAWTSRGEQLLSPNQVNIEKLLVSDGRVSVTGLTGGRELTLEKINAEVSASSLIGPWRIDASADVEGSPSDIKITTGTYQQSGELRLKIEANQKNRPYRLLVDGPVTLKNEVLAWNGGFTLSPFSKLQVQEMALPVEPLPVVAEGKFLASPSQIDIPDYRMELGSREDPYAVVGFGNIAVAERITFRATANGRQIDLDQIDAGETKVSGKSLESRIAVLRNILEQIPVPSIAGEIKMTLPALVAGDTYVRDVSTIIRPLGKGWDLRSFTAKFPGNTTLEAVGRLGLNDDFGFDGNVLLASRQPSGFASWITGDVDPAFRRLSQFGISSNVSITQRQARLENMELRMDDAVLKGRMQRISSKDRPPAILLQLAGNRVNVDNLKAIYSLIEAPDAKDEQGHDLDIDVKAETLEAQILDEPVLARGVDTKVRVRGGAVSIERFNADAFYGAKIRSSGRIENLLSKPNGNMRFYVSAANAASVLNFANKYFGKTVLIENLLSNSILTKDAELEIELDTTAQNSGARGQVLASGKLGGTDVDAKFGFEGSFDESVELPVTISGSLQNTAPSIVMRQLGIETLPVEIMGEVPGPISVDFDLDGKLGSPLQTNISVQLPETNISANGLVSTSDWSAFDTDVAITVGSSNFAPYAVIGGLRVPGLNIRQSLPVALSMNMKRSEGKTKFENLTGQVAGNSFAGSILWEVQGVARPRVSGDVKLDSIDMAMIADSVFGRQDGLAGDLSSQLGLDGSTLNFGLPYYSGFDADLNVEVQRIRFSDFLNGKNSKFKLVMLDGAIDANDLEFETLGGKFSGAVELKNTQGLAFSKVRYGFSEIDAKRLLKTSDLPEFLKGKVSLQGSSEATGQSFEALLANLSGNGLLTLNKLSTEGLNPSGFEAILRATRADDYEIESEAIKTLVRNTVLVSGTELGKIEAPFSITRGRLGVRNLTKEVDGTKLSGGFELDLPEKQVDASLDVTFQPNKRDAVNGAQPQIRVTWDGLFEKPERAIQTDLLEGYLSLRAFEKSQRRVELLEAKVLETQRLQQQVALSFAREKYKERQEQERQKIEQEAAQEKADEEARLEAIKLEEERKLAEEAEREQAEKQALEQKAREEAAAETARKQEAARLAEAARKAEAERLAAEDEATAQAAADEAARLQALRDAEIARQRQAARIAAEREAARREQAARLRRGRSDP